MIVTPRMIDGSRMANSPKPMALPDSHRMVK